MTTIVIKSVITSQRVCTHARTAEGTHTFGAFVFREK